MSTFFHFLIVPNWKWLIGLVAFHHKIWSKIPYIDIFFMLFFSYCLYLILSLSLYICLFFTSRQLLFTIIARAVNYTLNRPTRGQMSVWWSKLWWRHIIHKDCHFKHLEHDKYYLEAVHYLYSMYAHYSLNVVIPSGLCLHVLQCRCV